MLSSTSSSLSSSRISDLPLEVRLNNGRSYELSLLGADFFRDDGDRRRALAGASHKANSKSMVILHRPYCLVANVKFHASVLLRITRIDAISSSPPTVVAAKETIDDLRLNGI